MSCLTPEEFETVRRHPMLRTIAEFRGIWDDVCAEFGVDPAAISGITRGNATVCAARTMICRIAHDRGFSAAAIGRMIRRDHTSICNMLAIVDVSCPTFKSRRSV